MYIGRESGSDKGREKTGGRKGVGQGKIEERNNYAKQELIVVQCENKYKRVHMYLYLKSIRVQLTLRKIAVTL